MNQLDRIEHKLNLIVELMSVQGALIIAPHTKNPRKEWDKSRTLYNNTIEKYTKIIDENINDSASKSDSISR